MKSRYIDAVGKAIEIIEARIDAPPTPADVASQVGFSAYHFHRVFSALLGESITQYIRKRRLAKAAERLRDSRDPIMSLAVECGFDSQEAFTRAFKRMYGTTPGQYRQSCGTTTYVKKEATTLNMVIHMVNTIELKPKIVERGEDLAIGLGGGFSEGSFEQIKELWDSFLNRKNEVANQKPGYALGICMPAHPDIAKSPESQFVYIAAVPVSAADNVPHGMVSCKIAAGRYAMFTHKGPLSDLPLTVKYIWGTWLPGSEFQYAEGRPDFEYYDERFDGEREEGEFDIFVPIQ